MAAKRLALVLAPILWAAICCGGSITGQQQEIAPYSLRVDSTQRRDAPFKITHPEGAVVRAIFAQVTQGGVVWAYLPDSHFIRESGVTYMAAPPGEYLITLGDSQIVKVVEEGKPGPQPPGPQPPPDEDEGEGDDKPEGLEKIDYAIWLEESSERFINKEQSDTAYNPELWDYLSDQAIKRVVYDVDQAGAESWVKVVGDTLPALILFDSKAEKYKVYPAPKTVSEAKRLVSEAGK